IDLAGNAEPLPGEPRGAVGRDRHIVRIVAFLQLEILGVGGAGLRRQNEHKSSNGKETTAHGISPSPHRMVALYRISRPRVSRRCDKSSGVPENIAVQQAPPQRRPMHPIVILIAGFLVVFVGGGARYAIGLTLKPMVAELGWTRGEL